jgi:NADPH:quinone reductase
MEATMHAVSFDAPAEDTTTTRVANVPAPRPGPGQVTIDVAAAGINFADVMVRRGDEYHRVPYPVSPGLEAAGTVRELGEGVSGLAVGDRVAALCRLGGLAEVALAPAALTVPVPRDVDLTVAAAAPVVLATAVLLLDRAARLDAGESLLVHSAGGGVGAAVAQLARARGARRVIGSVGSPSRVAAAEAAGYDPVIVRGPGLADGILAATDGAGVDVVLDPLGTAELATDLAVAAPGARIVVFGNAGGGPTEFPLTTNTLMAGNVSIGGFSISALSARSPATVGRAVATALDLVSEGAFTVEVTVTDGLESAAEAQQALAEGRGRGKHVIRLRR